MINKWRIFHVGLLVFVLAACQTTLSPSPTPLPTLTTNVETVIQVKSRAMLVEVHGNGSIAVIMANTTAGSPYSWHTLVEAADLQRYTMVNFKYTTKDISSGRRDVTEPAAYLEGLGYEKIACVGGSLGAQACGVIAKNPTTVALVLLAGFKGADYDEVTIPKLFIAAETDFKQEMETQFLSAAEPKAIQIFPGGAHATDLFATSSGEEVVRVILDFLADIPDE